MRGSYGRWTERTPGSFWRDLPVTKGILLLWVLSFLGSFGGVTPWLAFRPLEWPFMLTGLLTYPLAIGENIIGLLLNGLMLYWFGGSLERSWGWRRYLGFLLLTNVTAVLIWEIGAWLVLRALPAVATPWLMLTSVIVAWAWLNPEETILFWFVLPLKAKWIGWLSIAILFFTFPRMYVPDARVFLLGFFALGGVAMALLYARHQRLWGWVPKPQRAEKRTRGPIRHPNSTFWGRLTAPWREWKRRRNIAHLKRTIKWE
jgi:hypothetical protein